MRDVVLVRHGESEWNAAHRWQGWIDVDLTERGIEQARARGRELAGAARAPVAAVYCSDLRRAHHTAALIAAELGDLVAVTDPGFRERHGGAFQGLTTDELASVHPAAFAAWRAGTLDAPPGGESAAEVLARFDGALAAAHAAAPPGVLVIVTHRGVARLVARRSGGAGAAVLPNCGELWLRYDGATLSLGADDERHACAGA